MRLNNINVQKIASVLGAKGKSKGGFALFKTAKTRIIATALAITLGAGGATAGVISHLNSRQADLPEAPTVTSDATTPDTNTPAADEFDILADSLDIDGLGMKNDMLTIEEQREKIAEEMGATYDGPTYEVTDENGNTTTWVSEDDYQKAVDKGLVDAPEGTTVVDYDQEVFVADDGTPFETAADRDAWNAYLKGLENGTNNGTNNSVVETEGNYYVAPDGSVWTSKEEYDKYQNSEGTTVTPVEDGTVIEEGQGYRAPDGTYWTSEADYLAYINSLDQNGLGSTTGSSTDTDVSYEDNFYHAPDGSVWASEQEYLDYINANTNSSGDSTYVDGSFDNDDVSYEDNYYHAPDGSVWASEEEYRNFLNGENNNQNDTSYEDVENDNFVYEEDNYYHAPDGSVWASEEDYQNFLNTSSNEISATQVYDEAFTQPELDELGGYVGEDGFYHVGEDAYVSKDAYLAVVNGNLETGSEETTEEVVVENQEQATIELDEYGGYVDPETGFYCVNGEFYATKADYVAIMQMDQLGQEESQKTM